MAPEGRHSPPSLLRINLFPLDPDYDGIRKVIHVVRVTPGAVRYKQTYSTGTVYFIIVVISSGFIIS
jgi:hypothetical protein